MSTTSRWLFVGGLTGLVRDLLGVCRHAAVRRLTPVDNSDDTHYDVATTSTHPFVFQSSALCYNKSSI